MFKAELSDSNILKTSFDAISSIVDIIGKNGKNASEPLKEYVSSMKKACNE